MKLVRFGAQGAERPGLVGSSGEIRDLSSVVEDIDGAGLSPESLAQLRRIDQETLPVVDGSERLGPCVAGIGKIVAVGLNYSDHAAEAGMDLPAEPILFMKATSAISGPNDPIRLPKGSVKTDWEVELGVWIGRTARYVREEEAFDYVAGYSVVNDVSERAYQLERSGQWVKGKSADTFAPVGPWMVTRDEIPDPQNLGLWLEVDGQRHQNGTTGRMVFGVATLVSYISHFMTLQPGDLIATGTPPGVGMGLKPPRYLVPGNVVRLGIDGLGVQEQPVIAFES